MCAPIPKGKWSWKFDRCINCGTTSTKGKHRHKGRGLCHSCWDKERDNSAKRQEIKKKAHDKWYVKVKDTAEYKQYCRVRVKLWHTNAPKYRIWLKKRNLKSMLKEIKNFYYKTDSDNLNNHAKPLGCQDSYMSKTNWEEKKIEKINGDNYHFLERVLTQFKNKEIGYSEAIHCIQEKYSKEILTTIQQTREETIREVLEYNRDYLRKLCWLEKDIEYFEKSIKNKFNIII